MVQLDLYPEKWPLNAVAGDFNHDGGADPADYAVWRDGLGTQYTQTNYALWQLNLGRTSAGSGVSSLQNVPEPSTIARAVLSLLGIWAIAGSVGKRARICHS